MSRPAAPHVDDADDLDDEGTLLLEQRFSIVPEWVLDADISDAALRLYAVLLRYGQTSGQRMPSRKLLATRMRKKSRDTVDRALKELVGIGAVIVQRRRHGQVNLTNCYVVRSSPPAPRRPAGEDVSSAPSVAAAGGGRKSAATSKVTSGGRKSAARGSRTDAATVAARVRPNPESFTQTSPPPPSPSPSSAGGGGVGQETTAAADVTTSHLDAALAGHRLDDVVARCRDARQRMGLPVGRWTSRVVGDVLAGAVAKGWPAAHAVTALITVAGDRETRSPARLSCPGPWWDGPASSFAASGIEAGELARLEERLAEVGGYRVALQRQARQELTAAGEPVTRFSVARRACALLDDSAADVGGAA